MIISRLRHHVCGSSAADKQRLPLGLQGRFLAGAGFLRRHLRFAAILPGLLTTVAAPGADPVGAEPPGALVPTYRDARLPGRASLLFRPKDLPAIRERAAGSHKVAYEALRKQADDWLNREVRLPERGGQWFHWYSCPKHGARLRTEGPTRHVCPVNDEVFTGYPYDDVVLSSEHNRLASAIRVLGLVYQIGQDSRHASKAREILLAYAEKYRSYPLHNIRGEAKVGGGKVGPQTLDESTWLITVVEGAACIWDTLSSEEKRMIKDGLLTPATDVIRQHKMGIHNIQCWKNSAVGLTGLLLGEWALVQDALEGPSGYHSQMAKGVTADGPWFEGAWGYHFYTLNAVMHLVEGAYNCGINMYGPELKRMFDAPLAMAMPDLTLPAFNDSQRVKLTGTSDLYLTAFARYGDRRYLLPAGGDSQTEVALLHGDANEEPVPVFEPVSRNFTASGNAILSSGIGSNATWVCLKYGPHGGGHGHPDKLNFVLYGHGQVIAPDPGTANYGVPIQGGWYRTTLAHNTLTVDEQSQEPAEGRCVAFIATNGFSAVMAEAGKVYDGVDFVRTLALVGTDLVMVVDQARAEKTHVYDLVYHNEGQLVHPGGDTFTAAQKPGYSYLRDLRARQGSAGFRVSFDLGANASVWWALAEGHPTTLITGTGVGRHTEDRVPLVIARREGTSTAYVWCIYLGANGEHLECRAAEVKLPNGTPAETVAAAAVEVTIGNVTHILAANPAGTPVLIGGQKVEGKVALLSREPDGKPRLLHAAH